MALLCQMRMQLVVAKGKALGLYMIYARSPARAPLALFNTKYSVVMSYNLYGVVRTCGQKYYSSRVFAGSIKTPAYSLGSCIFSHISTEYFLLS